MKRIVVYLSNVERPNAGYYKGFLAYAAFKELGITEDEMEFRRDKQFRRDTDRAEIVAHVDPQNSVESVSKFEGRVKVLKADIWVLREVAPEFDEEKEELL